MAVRTPNGLGKATGNLWREITGTYQLRPDELRLLSDCCREMDLIDLLQKTVDSGGVLVPGSRGQQVIKPAIQEIRQHRNVLKQMLAKLALPADPAGHVAAGASDRARRVAHARWQRKPA